MAGLSAGTAKLPDVARQLDAASAAGQAASPPDGDVLDELFARYTMERERTVHRDFLRRFGMTPSTIAHKADVPEAADDGIELF
jgi:methylphosphotriester-DNA--protein-cysteine methyltransferase